MSPPPRPEPKPRGQFLARVLNNEPICDRHLRLTLRAEAFPASGPGQFVQVQCRDPDPPAGARVVDWPEGALPTLTQPELTGTEPLLRRPLSIAGRRGGPAGRTELDLIYRTIGTGTHWLATVRPDAQLSFIGPLGNSFPIREDKPRAVLVGGGVGIPPMLYLAEALTRARKDVQAFCGAASAHLLPLTIADAGLVDMAGGPTQCAAEFTTVGVEAALSTDDGSLGLRGFVTELLKRHLQDRGGEGLVVYACGPERMMKAAAEICLSAAVECHLCLERYMACGMGTCQSCVCKIRADNEQGWEFKLCCSDGPVFDAADVVWD